MKIAVTYENGQVFQHFGHTEQMKVYTVEDGEIKLSQVISTNGTGHGALAGFLAELGVETLICGGIGGGAINALSQAGIKLCAGVAGDADAAVKALISGELQYSDEANCDHHHGEEHECGHHHHGEGPECGHHHHHHGEGPECGGPHHPHHPHHPPEGGPAHGGPRPPEDGPECRRGHCGE